MGDIISIIEKPPPHETTWWHGKKDFKVCTSFGGNDDDCSGGGDDCSSGNDDCDSH